MLEAPTHMLSSLGVGADTRLIDQNVWSMRELLTGSASAIAQVADIDAKRLPLAEQLSMKLASLKRMTAMIGMYLDPDWRLRLLSTLERLLSPEIGTPSSSFRPSNHIQPSFGR